MKKGSKQQFIADIHNKRTGKTIAESARICDKWWQKAMGLMFVRKPFDLIMRFKRSRIVTIHMFFVFFPIDILWIDESGKVVEIKERLLPFHVHHPKYFAMTVIELRAGTVEETGTVVGDKIQVTEY